MMDITKNIKEATERLTKVFYEISEKLYKQANAVGAATGATAENAQANTDNNGETVYDAEYNVENDDDKKDENK